MHPPEAENNIDHISESLEQSTSHEHDFFTPENSLIGNISTLQLLEEDSTDIMKKLVSSQYSDAWNDEEAEREIDNLCKELEDADPRVCKDEEPEYCIIRNECETNDGWLVVSDD